MAVSCALNVDNSTPDHGDTITVTYSVDGNDPVDPQGATIKGQVVVGGTTYNVSTSVTLPGTPAADVSYETPTCDGLEFTQGGSDAEFTAVVP
jgi:hypothetical protein